MSKLEEKLRKKFLEWQKDGQKALENNEARTNWCFIPSNFPEDIVPIIKQWALELLPEKLPTDYKGNDYKTGWNEAIDEIKARIEEE